MMKLIISMAGQVGGALLLMILLIVLGSQVSHAAGVVGDGTPASCTDTAYAAALTGGGLVTFNCGPNSVIIDVTTQVVNDLTTVVDGGGKVTLDGNGTLQLFLVLSDGDLTLRNIHLTRGLFSSGGAIYNDGGGVTTLNNVTITSSEGDGGAGDGGALYVNGGNVTVEDSDLSSNKADRNGAAIYLRNGTVTVRRTSFSNNSAVDGGAIYVQAGTLILENSLVRRNTASDEGGGFYASGGVTGATNVTFVDNKADKGGGLRAVGTSQVTLQNATVSFNHADTAGGLWNLTNNVTMRNTIVANNTNKAENGDSLDCDGPSVTSQGHNLISDGSCVNGSNASDLRNTDPKLGPLQDNGGNTFTRLPLPDSPAIDGGDNSGCPATDQRSYPRPIGSACDIGAAEVAFLNFLPTILR